jgi:iron complex outermembrane receptor protein
LAVVAAITCRTAFAQNNPPTPAAAEDSTALAEIVVTGTSIRGIKPVGSDTISLSSADIADQGVSSAADLLRDVPQVTNLGADESRTSPGSAQRGVANIAAGTGINLRGIGVEDTLTLIDGGRVPPGGGEGRFFDPNTLPLLAISRIEIVADGASGVYGSDAVAGVVNIIPVTRFEGVETQLRYGGADGVNQEIGGLLAGHSWTDGGAVLAFEYNRRSDLLASDRPDQYVNSPTYGATSTNSFPSTLANNAGPPPFAFPPAGGSHQFTDATSTGILNPANLAATTAAAPGLQGNWSGADALPEQTRKTFYAHVDQDITDRLQITAQGFFSQRDFERLNTAATTTGLAIPGLAAGPYQNAYNQTPATVAANYSFLGGLGNELQTGYERSYQGRLGLRLELDHDWRINLLGSAGETADRTQSTNVPNAQALSAAASCINPARPNGQFAPTLTNVTTCNTVATAFDPFSNLQPGTTGFGYPSTATYQSVLNSINGYTFLNPAITQSEVNLKADGPVAELPGGEIRLATGVDYQRLKRTNTTGGTTAGATTDDLITVQYPATHRSVESAFAELYIPIVGESNRVPGIENLALSVAGRYDHYHDSEDAVTDPSGPLPGFNQTASTTNPKIGLTWQPVDDVQAHASYGKSFRAPVLGDYSLGAPTLGIPFTVTPAVAQVLGLPARCATAGACDMVEIQGGTSGLKPETAKTFSLGADYKPAAVPGLSLSANYYHIELDHQIVVPGSGPWQSNPAFAQALANAGLLVANPAKGALGSFNPNTVGGYLSYGNNYVTNPALQYSGYAGIPGFLLAQGIVPTSLLVNALNVNSGELKTDGIDYSLSYTWSSNLGSFIVGDTGTYAFSYKQALADGTPLVNYLNQLNYPMRFQTRGQLGWKWAPLSANTFINYVNSYSNPGIGPVASFTTVDLSIAYSPKPFSALLSETRVALDVQNLLNKAPPSTINIPNQMAYDPQEASALGRFISLELTARF